MRLGGLQYGYGGGIVRPRTKLSLLMCRFSIIFQAEVHVISRCAEILWEKIFHRDRIVILTDSQGTLQTISAFEIKSKILLEYTKQLNRVIMSKGYHWHGSLDIKALK